MTEVTIVYEVNPMTTPSSWTWRQLVNLNQAFDSAPTDADRAEFVREMGRWWVEAALNEASETARDTPELLTAVHQQFVDLLCTHEVEDPQLVRLAVILDTPADRKMEILNLIRSVLEDHPDVASVAAR
jgi:hypothetical protein